MYNPLQPHGLQPARLLCPWDSPGKNTRMGCHFLLQGIFLTQGSDPFFRVSCLIGGFFTSGPQGKLCVCVCVYEVKLLVAQLCVCVCVYEVKLLVAQLCPALWTHGLGPDREALCVCVCVCIKLLVAKLCSTLQTHGLGPARLLCPWNSPGKNTGVGYHFLLQGIFLTQGLYPSLLHCRQIPYCLSHQGRYIY